MGDFHFWWLSFLLLKNLGILPMLEWINWKQLGVKAELCVSSVLTCWGSASAPVPPLQWRQGWFGPHCRCQGWCNTLPAPLSRQKPGEWRTRDDHLASFSDRVDTNLRNHPLEDVAAADGLENLSRDSLRDALQTLLHKRFTLQSNTITWRWGARRDSWVDGWTEWRTHLGVESGSCVKEELADFMHPVSITGGVFQAGEESTAHSHSSIQTSGHIACKHTNHLQSFSFHATTD